MRRLQSGARDVTMQQKALHQVSRQRICKCMVQASLPSYQACSRSILTGYTGTPE